MGRRRHLVGDNDITCKITVVKDQISLPHPRLVPRFARGTEAGRSATESNDFASEPATLPFG